MGNVLLKVEAIEKMEESQNYVLKKCVDDLSQHQNRLKELERTDFDDKFNHITRRMINDVVREIFTPIQMDINLAIKKIDDP